MKYFWAFLAALEDLILVWIRRYLGMPDYPEYIRRAAAQLREQQRREFYRSWRKNRRPIVDLVKDLKEIREFMRDGWDDEDEDDEFEEEYL